MGDKTIVFTLIGFINGSTLGYGAGGLLIFVAIYFCSDYVVTLEAIVKFSNKVELYFSEDVSILIDNIFCFISVGQVRKCLQGSFIINITNPVACWR